MSSVKHPVQEPQPKDERGQKTAEDRRKGKRLTLGFTIEVSGATRENRPFAERTRTSDVSESGCRFITDLPLVRGDIVSIRVVLPDGVGLFLEETACPFEIMWAEQSGKRWNVGARKLVASKPWKAITFPPERQPPQPK